MGQRYVKNVELQSLVGFLQFKGRGSGGGADEIDLVHLVNALPHGLEMS